MSEDLDEEYVFECPECGHRVLVETVEWETPTVTCGCGDFVYMEEVERRI